jgi:hypothetical protein
VLASKLTAASLASSVDQSIEVKPAYCSVPTTAYDAIIAVATNAAGSGLAATTRIRLDFAEQRARTASNQLHSELCSRLGAVVSRCIARVVARLVVANS